MAKIVYLDSFTANPGDLSWGALESLGEFHTYEFSTSEEAVERSIGAEVIIVNKIKVGESLLSKAPSIKYVVVSATGYNNVDLEACRKHHVLVSNVRGYSTSSVAQHVFSVLFALFNRSEYYNYKVRKGAWSECRDFCFYDHSIEEISGKTMGIVGYGNIGKKVAQIGEAFGMNILVATRSNETKQISENIAFDNLESIFHKSDILSLHAPLTDQTKNLINSQSLSKMKENAVLINTSRGGLINEYDLANHLNLHPKFHALLDVLSIEPPTDFHLLTNLSNCLATPHHAWASLQAREKLLDGVFQNISAYLGGNPINTVG